MGIVGDGEGGRERGSGGGGRRRFPYLHCSAPSAAIIDYVGGGGV
jgi:hypothetical protein